MYEEENRLYEEDTCMPEEDACVTEDEVVDGLRGLLMGESLEDTPLDNCRTCTYEDGGYMTYDKGFVIHLPDGSVFQVTVKQER